MDAAAERFMHEGYHLKVAKNDLIYSVPSGSPLGQS
jgi:hypothetical protein